SLSTTKQHFSDLDNYEEEKNVKKIKSYSSPLSFALLNNLINHHIKDKQLLIHRPSECVGPPTLEFINGMAEIYRSEHERFIVFKEKIRKLFGEKLRMISLEDDSKNDGVLEFNVFSKSVLRFLVEIKNEIGTGSCDLTIQASASFAKYYTQEIYGKKLIIDPLTDFIPFISTNNRAYVEQVALLFKALCLGVNRLKEYYTSLDIPTNQQNSYCFFLYPNQYKHQDTIIEFTYEEKLVDHKLFWKAITKDRQKIIVNKEMVDGFYMVVMDYVEAEPLYNCSSLSRNKYKAILRDVKEAIDKLHEKSIVFSDLCDSNILVNKSQGQYKEMLIDFDWASKDEIKCYLSFMNHKHINWLSGAEDRKKLSHKHDVYWLELLKHKYL
ncbi:19398_t:CDS:2, partial [Racocetra persica]